LLLQQWRWWLLRCCVLWRLWQQKAGLRQQATLGAAARGCRLLLLHQQLLVHLPALPAPLLLLLLLLQFGIAATPAALLHGQLLLQQQQQRLPLQPIPAAAVLLVAGLVSNPTTAAQALPPKHKRCC
jgi:hypothetical protein